MDALAILPIDATALVPIFITVYSYDNAAAPGYTNQLWIDEATGRVCYVSQHSHTQWHGNWTELPMSMASLRFNHAGDELNLKQAVLLRTVTGWRGVDYANRQVTMNRIFRVQWSEDTNSWNFVE